MTTAITVIPPPNYPEFPNRLTSAVTLTTNNGTASFVVGTLTGAVKCVIQAVVTTALSTNITAAHLRLNDGTNVPAVTAAAGTTLSSFGVGSLVSKTALAATAITATQNDQTRILEPGTANTPVLQECVIVAKTGATTTLDFRYTCNNQSSGVITFYIDWVKVSTDGSLV